MACERELDVPQSLNVPECVEVALVQELAVEAEHLLDRKPDLSLLRSRQLAELLVAHGEQSAGLLRLEKLEARIEQLAGCHVVDNETKRLLHSARDLGNRGVHHKGLKRAPHEKRVQWAHEALLAVAQAWAMYLDREVPRALKSGARPGAGPASSKPVDRLAEVHRRLDEAERFADVLRKGSEAEALLRRINPGPLRKAGVDERELELIQLRIDSIRRAVANHAGQPPTPLDLARSRRLVAWADARAIEEVLHLHNRHVIARLNVLQLAEALDVADELDRWRPDQRLLLPGALSVGKMYDWQRGAILGTRGQVLAMQAHAYEDASTLHDALDCFAEASQCFDRPPDLERQLVYRAHALIEILRLGGVLAPTEEAELDRWLGEWAVVAVHPDDRPFPLAAVLKAALVLGRDLAWAQGLASSLSWVDGPAQLKHPLSNVVGLLLALHVPVPKSCREALIELAETPAPRRDLNAWRAGLYAAHAGLIAAAPEPPASLRGWYDEYGIGERAPLDRLPFNYL